jgi:hypothetical protein
MFEIIYNTKKNKNVHFSNVVCVILIPKSNEFNGYHLWWDDEDFNNAYRSYIQEMGRLMEIHPFMNPQEAKKLLYQPNNISYDPRNFE